VTVQVEVLDKVTDEAVEAFARLLPQLSRSAPPLGPDELEAVVTCPANTVLVSRSAGPITGTLTLVMFPLPTGIRAWIEDVVVDQGARGQGTGEALTHEALRIAREAGARRWPAASTSGLASRSATRGCTGTRSSDPLGSLEAG
jgi:GNAT superfamily N-acetyltransferase